MKVQFAPSFFESLKNLNSIKSKWYCIRGWFKYHFNKDNWNLMKVCFKGRPWDDGFLYELEQAKIKEMMNYHIKHQRFVGWENVVRDMKICINLIDIFTEKKELFNYTGSLKFIPVKDSPYKEVDASSLKYHCNVYVNTKNIERFIPKGKDNPHIDYWKEHPHELYILKAKHLYHKIREEKDGAWWD